MGADDLAGGGAGERCIPDDDLFGQFPDSQARGAEVGKHLVHGEGAAAIGHHSHGEMLTRFAVRDAEAGGLSASGQVP